ncbi:hypothetical protein DVA67_006095 [Solirubrobacter sp. CPCC 204708]|uniref:HYR domain-containing protein n=1 Tax=Solirubrobacter deserti TaxID=2282478 RepID=A0ABT4RCQ4_9ACTN|nr:hypothetical protein [Solirubrobacter deserti]MBE2315538.1 hypothetical protein [Solirubrobacter deserti]MDA0136176.1 hypothetical protein [Solirubrobacter deserti]
MKRSLAGLAGVGATLAVGALAPSSALAHPCTEAWTLSNATFLTANNTGTAWAGSIPPQSNDADCAPITESLSAAKARSAVAPGDPVAETATYAKSENLTPLGYSARVPPRHPMTSLPDINSDIAFKGNYAFQGHWSGFRVIDITDPTKPEQVWNTENCRHTSGQGDVVVHGNILVRTWDSPNSTNANANATCEGRAVGAGFEGIHIWDISDPKNPQFRRQVRMAATGNEEGAPAIGCGAHTATGVPDDARGVLWLYVGGSGAACPGIDIVRINQNDLMDAKFVNHAYNERGRNPTTGNGQSCHDNNVLMGVDGSSIGYAMCAGGNGLTMYKFDMSKAPDAAGTVESPGGVANPTVAWTKVITGVGIGHSGSFTYDGKVLIFGHEPGGGTGAACEATDSVVDRSLFFLNSANGETLGTFVQPRPQSATENCTWHNFNVVPTYKGYYAVSGNYEMGISVFDFTNVQAPQQIAYADPSEYTPEATNTWPTSGNWSTHYYNGRIYESDIRRGLLIWNLDHDSMRRVRTPDLSNPQTQIGGVAQDLQGPTITSTDEGKGYKQGSTQAPQFTCTDADSGVESCIASVTNLNTSTFGPASYTVTATDKAGNTSTKTVNYTVTAETTGTVGGSVGATLSLEMGTAASFAPFVPGVAQEYTATTTPTVTSTAGDATLSVTDPSTTNKGHLVNGSFVLPQPLQGLGTVKTYTGPVSNDKPTITFKQAIGANDALRTGTYSKTLTFTLSTTNP